MKHVWILCTLAVAIAFPTVALFPASANAQQIDNPCEGAEGVLARACEEARDLLMYDIGKPDIQARVWAIRTAQGWLYRYENGEDSSETACADPGPLVLPRNERIELVCTSHDAAYDWSAATLEIDLALLPGRLETTVIRTQDIGYFAGDISEISGAPLENGDGSARIVEPSQFASWLLDAETRLC
jgi:heme/copper-type cytochrome/quinol oxidase subunit 2